MITINVYVSWDQVLAYLESNGYIMDRDYCFNIVDKLGWHYLTIESRLGREEIETLLALKYGEYIV